jgi:hypothetical protein
VTVERVDLAISGETSSHGVDERAERVREMLQSELDGLRGKLPGVFWYDMAVLDRHTHERPTLLLVSRTNAGQTLVQYVPRAWC